MHIRLKQQTLLQPVAHLVEALRSKPEGRGLNSRCFYQIFSLTYFFRPHYGPRVDSAYNRNKYQECFLGAKAAGALGWQPYNLHLPIFMKSRSLNLLEPSGPIQACNVIALPLYQPLGLFCPFFKVSCHILAIIMSPSITNLKVKESKARDRERWRTVVSAVMNLRVPWNAGNFLTSCKPVSFSRRTLHHGVSK